MVAAMIVPFAVMFSLIGMRALGIALEQPQHAIRSDIRRSQPELATAVELKRMDASHCARSSCGCHAMPFNIARGNCFSLEGDM